MELSTYITQTLINVSQMLGGNWELLTTCVNQRKYYAIMTTVGNYIMSMGCQWGSNYLNTIKRFDGDTWTTLANTLTYGGHSH